MSIMEHWSIHIYYFDLIWCSSGSRGSNHSEAAMTANIPSTNGRPNSSSKQTLTEICTYKLMLMAWTTNWSKQNNIMSCASRSESYRFNSQYSPKSCINPHRLNCQGTKSYTTATQKSSKIATMTPKNQYYTKLPKTRLRNVSTELSKVIPLESSRKCSHKHKQGKSGN